MNAATRLNIIQCDMQRQIEKPNPNTVYRWVTRSTLDTWMAELRAIELYLRKKPHG